VREKRKREKKKKQSKTAVSSPRTGPGPLSRSLELRRGELILFVCVGGDEERRKAVLWSRTWQKKSKKSQKSEEKGKSKGNNCKMLSLSKGLKTPLSRRENVSLHCKRLAWTRIRQYPKPKASIAELEMKEETERARANEKLRCFSPSFSSSALLSSFFPLEEENSNASPLLSFFFFLFFYLPSEHCQ
jgi:hypothetical protein